MKPSRSRPRVPMWIARFAVPFALLAVPLIPAPLHAGSASFLRRWSLSAGVSDSWTTRKDRLEQLHEPDWLFEGHTSRFGSVAFTYHIDRKDPTFRMFLQVTLEGYDARFQYWTRETVGTMHATVLRVDPLCLAGRLGKGNLYFSATVGGVNFLRGDIDVLEGYSLYFPSGGWLYLVKSIDLEQNAAGWSLFGFGLHYRFPHAPLMIGAETVLIEADNPKVTFKTYGGDFQEDSVALYGLFPIKLRVSLQP